MRLSEAGLRRRRTKALYPNHRPSPWLNEDATRDRSNRLLEGAADYREVPEIAPPKAVPPAITVTAHSQGERGKSDTERTAMNR